MVVKKDQFIIFGQVDHRFLFPLKIENPSQKEHNRILYGAEGERSNNNVFAKSIKVSAIVKLKNGGINATIFT